MKFFLRKDNLFATVSQLITGLDKLTPRDNFFGFEWEGTVPASTEVRILNEFRNGLIPNRFVITDAVGVNSIVRGDEAWSDKIVTLKNTDGATDAVIKVLFYMEGR